MWKQLRNEYSMKPYILYDNRVTLDGNSAYVFKHSMCIKHTINIMIYLKGFTRNLTSLYYIVNIRIPQE